MSNICNQQTKQRKPRIPRGKIRYRGLTVDLQTGLVSRGEGEKDELQLTPAECALFGCLLGRIGRPVTREKMLNRIWGTSVPVRSRTTDMHITHLRRKLDLKDEIVTVFQVGYMLRR